MIAKPAGGFLSCLLHLFTLLMSQNLSGNLIVVNCGIPSATSNASLAAVINEALNHEERIEEILGSLNGLHGLLNEDIIDLASESQQTIRALRQTPSTALGSSSHYPFQDKEAKQALSVLEAHCIRYVILIGDHEAIQAAQMLQQAAQASRYVMSIVVIPSSSHNHISVTDHTIGYGTLAKHMACTLREISLLEESLPRKNQVTLIATGDGKTGWAAAASLLAHRKNQPTDAPHLICIPELAFEPNQFLNLLQNKLQIQGWCVVVVSEGLVDATGNYVAPAGVSSHDWVKGLIQQQLNVPIRTINVYPSSLISCLTDIEEAETMSKHAVIVALESQTASMVTFCRSEAESYQVEIGTTSIDQIASTPKTVPTTWINAEEYTMQYSFMKYASPLIQGETIYSFEQGIVKFAQLSKQRIEKKNVSA